jgi:hypothetical protein
MDFLEQLGQFAREHDMPLRFECRFHRGHCHEDAERRHVEHQRRGQRPNLRQLGIAVARPGRMEPV